MEKDQLLACLKEQMENWDTLAKCKNAVAREEYMQKFKCHRSFNSAIRN